MRLAVIADVHGNRPALEAVLEDLRGLDVDTLVVAGDMVNRGPSNAAVLQRFLELEVPLLLGNHDDLLRMWIDRDTALPGDWFGHPFWEGTAWCARQLQRQGMIEPLRGLPLTHAVEAPGAPALLIAHGSPRHYREGYGRFLTEDDIEEISREYQAGLLVGAHTHIPLERRSGDVLVLNCGAVGAPFNGDVRAQYLLLSLRGQEWSFEFRKVPYDRGAARRDFESSGYLEEGGLSARIFFEELRLARSLLTPFLNWVEGSSATLDEEGWRDFQRRFPERFAEPALPAS